MPITRVPHTVVTACVFPYSRRSDNPPSRTRGRFGASKCQHPDKREGEKQSRTGKEEEAGREEERRGEERRMMKNKANARVAATGQRSIFPFSSKALVDGGKDKG